jgi:hypothetical protein
VPVLVARIWHGAEIAHVVLGTFETVMWAAIGICPLAASRRCPLMATSSRRALAAGATTAVPVLPSTNSGLDEIMPKTLAGGL